MIWVAQAIAGGTAIVVGANAPAPGTAALRYAQDDARKVGETLKELGHLDRVEVMLDPSPEAVLDALRRGLDAPGDLVFYYSGHGDADALYPRGRALPLDDLRALMEEDEDRLTIGILDTCRGGSWTQTKGLQPDALPFPIGEPRSLGHALIASTSGTENAHELERLRGSVFTHHLIAGLRGAADRSGEGDVTLMEVFDYAKALTALDAALYTELPQTPSFAFNLRGRQDVVLASVARAPAVLEIRQNRGPLEVFQLESGTVFATLEAGKRNVNLAVPPGQYVLRKRNKYGGVAGTQLQIRAGEKHSLGESDLALQTRSNFSVKGGAVRNTDVFALPGHGELGINYGFRDLLNEFAQQSGAVFGKVALSRRLQLALPGQAHVRLTSPDSASTVALRAGISEAQWYPRSASISTPWEVTTVAGPYVRVPFARHFAWHLNLRAGLVAGRSGDLRNLDGGLAHLGMPYQYAQFYAGSGLGFFEDNARFSLFIGADLQVIRSLTAVFLEIGSIEGLSRRTPLLSVHISRNFSLDAYGTAELILSRKLDGRAGFTLTL